MSQDQFEKFLAAHPLKSKWLDDIISVVLHRPNGTAHISDIAHDLRKDRDVDAMDEAITRTINNYCSQAADFDKSKQYDLFERVSPATYRLQSYPAAPDTMEIVRIEFSDPVMDGMWDLLCDKMKKLDLKKWTNATNRQKLRAFAKWMTPGGDAQIEYQRRKAAIS